MPRGQLLGTLHILRDLMHNPILGTLCRGELRGLRIYTKKLEDGQTLQIAYHYDERTQQIQLQAIGLFNY